jgi:hypothetical protein
VPSISVVTDFGSTIPSLTDLFKILFTVLCVNNHATENKNPWINARTHLEEVFVFEGTENKIPGLNTTNNTIKYRYVPIFIIYLYQILYYTVIIIM